VIVGDDVTLSVVDDARPEAAARRNLDDRWSDRVDNVDEILL
jgi:hypothetical protein